MSINQGGLLVIYYTWSILAQIPLEGLGVNLKSAFTLFSYI